MTAPAPDQLASKAVELCRADGCVVLLTEESEANLRWANNSLTTAGVTDSRRMTVIATVSRAAGTSTGVVSHCGEVDGALPELVAAAEAAAQAAEPAEDAQPLVTGVAASADWSAPAPGTSVAAFGGLTPALGEAFGRARGSRQTLHGYAEHRARSTYLASSTGLRLRTDESTSQLALTARSPDRDASAWAGAAGDLSGDAVDRLYTQVDRQLGWAARRVELPPGRYETVLPPAAVADLMNYVYWSGAARDATEGRTVYSASGGGTRIGERLSDLPLTLCGDPGAVGLECAPFVLAPGSDGIVSVFDNGTPLRRTEWLSGGVLAALLQTRHSAALTGMAYTPHIDNLILEQPGATGSQADLVTSVDCGLLLTTLWYIREVDPATLLLTGLTRDGVYRIERGEVVGAVNNFRFNERPVDLLGRVLAVGATGPTRAREWGGAFSHCAMPPLRVADFSMSSVSRAT